MQKIPVLHSRYNPEGEADRYLNSVKINQGTQFFILIEPGMGYLSAVIKNEYRSAKIIALHAETLPMAIPEKNKPHAAWSPQNRESLREFLEREIPDIEAGAIKIIEWRPALLAYGEAYRFLLSETVEFIKQADASARTQNKFGRRWFKNFFRNLGFISKIILPQKIAFPFTITGAGPGLEDTIPFILKEKENFMLLAVSSSVAALKEKNLSPDLIIATDGGGWALLHLYECFRENALKINGTANIGTKLPGLRPGEVLTSSTRINFAVNLTAALPSQCKDAGLLIMCDGSLWQSLLLRELEIPFITLPQRGTVSASALDLAFALTEDKVFLTGLDLSHRDIQSHARPYSFDRIWNEKATRVNPAYSQVFARSGLISAGGSHAVYANWFSRQLAAYPKRLYSLGTNNQVFSMLETASRETMQKPADKPKLKTIRFKFQEKPARRGIEILRTSLANSEYSAALYDELRSLLCPGEYPSINELIAVIFSLTEHYG